LEKEKTGNYDTIIFESENKIIQAMIRGTNKNNGFRYEKWDYEGNQIESNNTLTYYEIKLE